MRDANEQQRCAGVVQSVQWHPQASLLLAAGLDKRLSFFVADGTRNDLVQSLFLADLPVLSARFVAGGTQVVASGRRPFFYVANLAAQRVERIKGLHGRSDASLERFAAPPAGMCDDDQRACLAFYGAEGSLPLVSIRSKQLVGELRMSGSVRAAAFAPDGVHLYTAGGDGSVHIWDVRMRRCCARFVDDGAVTTSALAASATALASGSHSGIVNVYDRGLLGGTASAAGGDTVLHCPAGPAQQQPLKCLDNLVTAVDTMEFSTDGNMLCIASRLTKQSLRVVHMPTLTVFSNWPTSRSPLHYVHCAAFSPGSALLAVGNAKGHVLTYRLHHYADV